MFKVTSKAPTRIDLAGGTIDLWPIHQLLEKCLTLNIALDLTATVEINQTGDDTFQFASVDQKMESNGSFEALTRDAKFSLIGLTLRAIWQKDWGGLKIKCLATSPAGAGLGGSSCLAVCIASALFRMRKLVKQMEEPDETGLVNLCQDVESSIIKVPPGCQDYWGAVRGAINVIRFNPGKTIVETTRGKLLESLNRHLIICYSGQSRASGINNWAIFKKFFDADKDMVKGLNKIGALAVECSQYAMAGDIPNLFKTSAAEWSVRTNLFPQIHTEHTRKLAEISLERGAFLSRVCGAGGGGVMAIFAPEEKRANIQSALTEAGGQILPAKLCPNGLSVIHSG